MLNLYAGRENIDKEGFIYDRIADDGGETFVLVPNQYTLVAEEQALKYLDADCLFDVEILSMNRLGLRLLTEQGRESVPMLDKYGRFMLLTRLIREHMEDFDIFRRSAGRMTFTSMLSDFISQFKQQNCSLDDFAKMLQEDAAFSPGSTDISATGSTEREPADSAKKISPDPLLRAKLAELEGVVRAYEEAIDGKYTDSEDYIASYIRAIASSQMIKDKSIWIYGYDSITPKFTDAMFELALACRSVNFIVNRSDFELDEQLIKMLYARSAEPEWKDRGFRIKLEEISPAYELPRSETIRRIERGLWSRELSAEERAENADFVPVDLTLVRSVNPYAEAESAAAYILHLVRDLGYRMRDIQVIANDEGSMQPVIRRVFEEYGLPVFADSTRDITDTPAVGFIVNLLWFAQYRGSAQYLFAMLKTGLTPYEDEAIEDLENYASSYHIKGSMWDHDFRYGEENIGSERFAALGEMRADIMKHISPLDELLRPSGQRLSREASADYLSETDDHKSLTVAGFVKWFKAYLRDVWALDKAVEDAANADEEAGLHDEAQRLVQSYNKALELLDQIVQIMGDVEMDLADFTDIYVSGLTGVEVGVIPPAADGLSMGTMIRTRPRPVRAAVILGANEGTLPLSPSPEGLFSVDEKAWFRQVEFPIGALDDIKLNEEKAAMYRMMAKPSEKLYISWSMTDVDGGDAAPSELIESLRTLFPRIDEDGLIRDDIVTAGWNSSALISDDRSFSRQARASSALISDDIALFDQKSLSEHRSRVNRSVPQRELDTKSDFECYVNTESVLNAIYDTSQYENRENDSGYCIDGHCRDEASGVTGVSDLFNSEKASLRHLTEHLKDKNVGDYSDTQTQALLKWFDENRHEELQTMLLAAADNNDPRPLAGGIPAALFGRRDGSLVLSASSINSYFECPFKFYIDWGLRPKEERAFRSDPRSIGDAYHECLMAVARRLMGSDRAILERIRASGHEQQSLPQASGLKDESEQQSLPQTPDSENEIGQSQITTDANAVPGLNLADRDIERLVSEELDRIAANYNGGLFISAGSEQFRMSRIREICSAAASAMAQQLAAESVEDAEFEEGFRRGGRFKPITLDIDGTKVYVEGKIDRADYLTVRSAAISDVTDAANVDKAEASDDSTESSGSESSVTAADTKSERVRVIDYKTGSDKLDVWKMRNGYKMQLMIYMISATSDNADSGTSIGGAVSRAANTRSAVSETVAGSIDAGNVTAAGQSLEPAGIFYFNIRDPIESADRMSDRKLSELKAADAADAFKLKGSYIDEPGVLGAMPAEVLAGSRSAHSSMTREEYEVLRNDVLDRIKETASGILSGNIRIRPFKDGKKLVCNYCTRKSICMRDREYVRNSGWELPPEPKPDARRE